jgi:hypothetical protein
MIHWSTRQRGLVEAALQRHPAESSECANAAQSILPTAREIDDTAHARIIVAENALYIQPKGPSRRWVYHVTVAVTENHVDVLTGPDGFPQETYLETYFHHPEVHTVRPVEPDEWATL